MLDVHFVLLGAAVASVGTGFYLWDTLRGATQPNRVTWLLWSAAPLVAFAVEVHDGVGLRSLMTFVVGFSPLLIFLASFYNQASYWRIGWLDYVCGALSVAGLGVWLITRHGTVAIAASIAADALAAAPTLLKSWKEPETETAAVYFGSTANAAITLLTIRTWTTAVDAFPIYIAFISAVEIALVAGRLGARLRLSLGRPAPR
ncbi:MAG: hypothetical protein ACYCTI_07650 [Acidimicrobiales bacterium]